jgi:pimeloyl-ACP methyl ester carboxylesterase/DNA-binding CsgD family transcriptional regulator
LRRLLEKFPRSPATSVRFCTAADGTRIAFEQLGSGPPIVKAANWMSHLDEDRDSPLWRHWLALLASGRQLTRFDGRGYGLSDRHPGTLSFAAMRSDLEAVADAAQLSRFALLGFCHGGPLAIDYAVRHPERVSCLVLCGTYAQGLAQRDASERGAAERDLLLRTIEIGWGHDSPAYRQVFATKAVPEAPAEVFTSYCRIQRASAEPRAALALTQLFWNIDVLDLLPQVRCPTLVLHATRDALVPFGQGHLLARSIAGARLVSLDSGNHDLLASEPAWPVLAHEIQEFLAAHDAAAAPAGGRSLEVLSGRERAVLDAIARGLDNDEIAAALHLSEKTVRNYVTSIFAKLDFASRSRAIVWARDAGLGRTAGPQR